MTPFQPLSLLAIIQGAKGRAATRSAPAERTGCVQIVVGCTVNGNDAASREADEAQANYYRRELSGLRARAQSDLARRCIELQQLQGSGLATRAADVRRIIRALKYEIATLQRLGQGLGRWF